jgi:hypothetical protein
MGIKAGEHLRGVSHPAQIGADVDGVGDKQGAGRDRNQRSRKFVMKRAS